jgi:hypothetical protein
MLYRPRAFRQARRKKIASQLPYRHHHHVGLPAIGKLDCIASLASPVKLIPAKVMHRQPARSKHLN